MLQKFRARENQLASVLMSAKRLFLTLQEQKNNQKANKIQKPD
jgi:hypothetical protein